MKTLLLRAYAELVASHNRFSHTGNSDPSCLRCKLRDEIGAALAAMLTESVTITNGINVSPEAPRPATPVRECVYKGFRITVYRYWASGAPEYFGLRIYQEPGGVESIYDSTCWESGMTADRMLENGKKFLDERLQVTALAGWVSAQPYKKDAVLPLSEKADILTLAVFHRGIEIRVYRLRAGCEWSLDVKAPGLLDFVRAMPHSSMWFASRAATEARTLIDKELDGEASEKL